MACAIATRTRLSLSAGWPLPTGPLPVLIVSMLKLPSSAATVVMPGVSLQALEQVRGNLAARVDLTVLERADHGLVVVEDAEADLVDLGRAAEVVLLGGELRELALLELQQRGTARCRSSSCWRRSRRPSSRPPTTASSAGCRRGCRAGGVGLVGLDDDAWYLSGAVIDLKPLTNVEKFDHSSSRIRVSV